MLSRDPLGHMVSTTFDGCLIEVSSIPMHNSSLLGKAADFLDSGLDPINDGCCVNGGAK